MEPDWGGGERGIEYYIQTYIDKYISGFFFASFLVVIDVDADRE